MYAASYSVYSQTVVFEDEVHVKPSLGSVDSNIGLYQGNALVGSRQNDAMNFFSFNSCKSGFEQSYTTLESGAKIDIGCSACADDLFSTGFSGCQDCDYWRAIVRPSSY